MELEDLIQRTLNKILTLLGIKNDSKEAKEVENIIRNNTYLAKLSCDDDLED